jgi:hypothetical protein
MGRRTLSTKVVLQSYTGGWAFFVDWDCAGRALNTDRGFLGVRLFSLFEK